MTDRRTMSIFAHSRDCTVISFPNGEERDGYVPDGLGIGGGDDVELEIDIDTGQIIGWTDVHRDAVLAMQETIAKSGG